MNTRKLISFDWALKRLLRSKANYEILEGFLSELLKDDIQILEFLESESNRDYQCILFATVKAITEHLAQGDPYDQVIKVISINILHFDLGHCKDYIYHGKPRFLGLHYHDELLLSDRQQKLFDKRHPHELYPEYSLLKVKQFDDVARDSLDEWIYFLKNQEIKEEFRAKGLKRPKRSWIS